MVTGLAATTHPDRVGDILSEKVIDQIVSDINNTNTAGGDSGAFRSVSLFHDWVKENDPTLDEVAFLKPSAEKVELADGHYGAKVEAVLNKHYRGDMSIDEVKYRIDNGQISGFSIEYDDDQSREIEYQGEQYRFIESIKPLGGLGLARARMIANPMAVIYKEIVAKVKEDDKMDDEQKPSEESKPEAESEAKPVEESKEEPKAEVPSEEKEKKKKKDSEEDEEDSSEEEKKKKKMGKKESDDEASEDEGESESDDKAQEMKEMDIDKITAEVKETVLKELKVKSKTIKQTKEDVEKMEEKTQVPLSVKEMKEAIKGEKVDMFKYKEAVSSYFAENPEIDAKLRTTGIPLQSTMKVKCAGTKLRIASEMQVKSTLTQDTNAGAYTESIVEFADVFTPGIIETFNNQTNLFGAMRKVDHIEGGNFYGWRIKTDQAATLSVDPDDPSIVFDPVAKLKLRTDIKEYRVGVSVTDYVQHHSRAVMGDLLMREAELRMGDMMRDINDDLFTEQADGDGNQILGLEAVADSAGNTTLYGKTRSAANRLSPAAAANTYQEVGGALTTAYLRDAIEKVLIEGARRENLRFIMGPQQITNLYELEDGNQNYFTAPKFGFEGQPSYDGIPIIVDSSCQADAVFLVDFESYYMVISRAPQMIGLAKVGAADSAYISAYLAAVYEQPRRIHMLNTLT